MFRRSSKSAPPPPPIAPPPTLPVDPSLGSGFAVECTAALRANRLDEVERLMIVAPSVDHVSQAVTMMADDAANVPIIRGWRITSPASSAAATVQGVRLVVEAWEVRGNGPASGVAKQAWAEFHDRLGAAEEHLLTAVELQPNAAAAWAYLQASGRGLQISKGELQLRYRQAVKVQSPTMFLALQYLQSMCAKWSGSSELMHQTAVAVASAAPLGSPLRVLPVQAHLEDAIAADGDPGAALANHLPHIRTAIADSVDHPAFVDDGPAAAIALNIAAGVLARVGADVEADRLRARIGTRVHTSPWSYFLRDPAVAYQRRWPAHSSSSPLAR